MADQLQTALSNPDRLQTLRQTFLLDAPAQQVFDRLTRLATVMLDVPVALVSLVDDNRQFFTSCVGLPEPYATTRETPLSHSFCQYVVASRSPLIIEDARLNPLVATNLAIPDLNVIAYAGFPLFSSDGFALGSFCVIDSKPRAWTPQEISIVEDLAAFVITEIELLEKNRVAEEAVRTRDELLFIVSHDLKNPLTAIKGMSQLAQRRLSAAEPKIDAALHLLSQVDAAATRMTSLLQEMVDFVTLREGKPLSLQRRPVDLVALCNHIIAEFQQIPASPPINLTFDAPAIIGQWDETRLERIVSNLISNSIKYGRNEPVSVKLSTDTLSGDNVAILEVQDKGMGIAEEEMDRIWDRFFRGRAVSDQISGSGIGLATVRQAVEQHGGTINVKSTKGVGSSFTVILPIEIPA